MRLPENLALLSLSFYAQGLQLPQQQLLNPSTAISVNVEAEKGVEGEGVSVVDGEVEEVDGGGLWLVEGAGGEVRFGVGLGLSEGIGVRESKAFVKD